MNTIAAVLFARLLTAAYAEPVCVPTQDPRVQECAIKANHDVSFMTCLETRSGKTCFAK